MKLAFREGRFVSLPTRNALEASLGRAGSYSSQLVNASPRR
jgi:hypothetical protein